MKKPNLEISVTNQWPSKTKTQIQQKMLLQQKNNIKEFQLITKEDIVQQSFNDKLLSRKNMLTYKDTTRKNILQQNPIMQTSPLNTNNKLSRNQKQMIQGRQLLQQESNNFAIDNSNDFNNNNNAGSANLVLNLNSNIKEGSVPRQNVANNNTNTPKHIRRRMLYKSDKVDDLYNSQIQYSQTPTTKFDVFFDESAVTPKVPVVRPEKQSLLSKKKIQYLKLNNFLEDQKTMGSETDKNAQNIPPLSDIFQSKTPGRKTQVLQSIQGYNSKLHNSTNGNKLASPSFQKQYTDVNNKNLKLSHDPTSFIQQHQVETQKTQQDNQENSGQMQQNSLSSYVTQVNRSSDQNQLRFLNVSSNIQMTLTERQQQLNKKFSQYSNNEKSPISQILKFQTPTNKTKPQRSISSNNYTQSQKQSELKPLSQLDSNSNNTEVIKQPQLQGKNLHIPTSPKKSYNNTNNQQLQMQQALQQQLQPLTQKDQQKAALYYISSVENAYKMKNMSQYFAVLFQEHFNQTFQGVLFSKLAKPMDPTDFVNKKVFLGQNLSISKKTIIFDLDETLIHCNETYQMPADVIISVQFPSGETVKAGINIRPFAKEILQEISKYFEVIIFTASHSSYAQKVINVLDPNEQFVHHKFFREQCIMTQQGLFIKDLRIFADRNLEDITIIDNATYSFCFQLENGIPIVPYYNNKEDQELKILAPYLKDLANCPDIREVNRNSFKLQQYSDFDGPSKVLEKLFKLQI